MGDIYVSVDIESDGPIPGPHSMLSIGAVAFTYDRHAVGDFTCNLELLPDASGDPETMAWWAKPEQQAAWVAHRQQLHTPECVMKDFVAWVKSLPGKPVFVAYPVGFDWMFVCWYMHRFAGENPFGHGDQCIDVKSYAASALRASSFTEAKRKTFPPKWSEGLPPHTHHALDDAREQGLLFLNIMHDVLERA